MGLYPHNPVGTADDPGGPSRCTVTHSLRPVAPGRGPRRAALAGCLADRDGASDGGRQARAAATARLPARCRAAEASSWTVPAMPPVPVTVTASGPPHRHCSSASTVPSPRRARLGVSGPPAGGAPGRAGGSLSNGGPGGRRGRNGLRFTGRLSAPLAVLRLARALSDCAASESA
jgi:hypothetical protein